MASSSRTPSPAVHEASTAGAVYQISNESIALEVDFVEEIGNGNWGSVWLVRPKRSRNSEHPAFKEAGRKFAIKIVHRSKSAANSSRIKSLWNEMKIVRTFKDDPHPSIISFHSFIQTPSFAMITMTYLPILIPVEVEEDKCRDWFLSLLSGVDFLHRRGVVHNDIKPANILLSHSNVPVLVDFGFAELKDAEDDAAFHSNLAYGTPEYLSPERARGITHDTRKSDVWSLGVTFFEILTGRTPFEEYDGAALETKEDVEKYWSRTLRGKWLGEWDFSDKMEKLLGRMMSPNADLRCTAKQALADGYWKSQCDVEPPPLRKTPSVPAKREFLTPPKSKASDSQSPRASPASPPGLPPQALRESSSQRSLNKPRSRPKVAVHTAGKAQPRKKGLDLSPIKGSPPASPARRSARAKENTPSKLNPNKDAPKKARQPFGAVVSPENNIDHIPVKKLSNMTGKRHSGVFAELKKSRSNLAMDSSFGSRNSKKNTNTVRNRVLEWEREKQRLREMERLEQLERERDEYFEEEKRKKGKMPEEEATEDDVSEAKGEEESLAEVLGDEEPFMMVAKKEAKKTANNGQRATPKANRRGKTHRKENGDKENVGRPQRIHRPSVPPTLAPPATATPLGRSSMMNTPVATLNGAPEAVSPKPSKQNIFKHGLKASIDKTLQFYKASSIGRAAGSHAPPSRGPSFEIAREAAYTARRASGLQLSNTPVSAPLTSPPSATTTTKNPLMSDTQRERMAAWMKNVEKVVQDANADIEPTAPESPFKQAPLPVPVRVQRSRRAPRRMLAASQIFNENGDLSYADTSYTSGPPPSAYSGPMTSTLRSSSAGYEPAGSTVVSPTNSQFFAPEAASGSKPRRVTMSAQSTIARGSSHLGDTSSIAKGLNPKSLGRASCSHLEITPADAEDKRLSQVAPKLVDVVPRSLFVAPTYTSRDDLLDAGRETSSDEHSSICHVEPYPQTRASQGRYCDTPERQLTENVYDRFLMSTGVKRNGKGYQSEAPIASLSVGPSTGKKESLLTFYTARKPMPPAVSSEDVERGTVSVDEVGVVHIQKDVGDASGVMKDESMSSTVALVRRAFKAIVPGKAVVSRRLSRA